MRSKSHHTEPQQTPTAVTLALFRSSSAHCVPRPPRVDPRAKKIKRLSHDDQQLNEQIARLHELRQLLCQRHMTRAESAVGSLSKTVHTYFNVFSHGYIPPPSGINSNQWLLHPDRQLPPLGDGRGHAWRRLLWCRQLIEQWKRFSVLFGDLQLRLLDLHIVPLDGTDEDDMRALATAHVAHAGHVTLQTIEILFPHVLSDVALVMSILGRQVSGDGKTDFIFDCNTAHVIECRIDIDMVGTFARIVQSPRDLAILFKMVLLTSQCFVGEKDCIPEGKAVPDTTTTRPTEDRMSVRSILSPPDEEIVRE